LYIGSGWVGESTTNTLAAWRGFGEVVELLIQRGAAVPATGPAARRLVQHAAAKGLGTLFMKLASLGTDLSLRNERGGTLLNDAAGGGSTAIVGELLARKLPVGEADRDGWTPLHDAAFMGRLEVVKALVAGGASLNARNVLGQTPWNLAQEHGLTGVADWLAGRGANQAAPQFPALTGDYLGQPPPGRTPAEFAVGIVGGHFMVHSSLAFSPDGRRIYDMARRPVAGQQAGAKENIWVADRAGAGWGDPRPLDAVVNALPHHWQFAVGPDGAVYFNSRWKGASGLFVSRLSAGRYEEPVALDAPVRASGTEAMPFVAADGSYLLFQRNYDIHVSFRGEDGAWLSPASLPEPVNTSDSELCPVVSPDRRYLFFIRSGHVYWVDAAVIEELRPGSKR
jgi:hypothetical protein